MQGFRSDRVLHIHGKAIRVCRECNCEMRESNSGWYCHKCGRYVKRKWSSRFRFLIGMNRA